MIKVHKEELNEPFSSFIPPGADSRPAYYINPDKPEPKKKYKLSLCTLTDEVGRTFA